MHCLPGTIVSWDNSLLGQLSPGTIVSLGQLSPGTIVSWDNSLLGQLSPGTIVSGTTVPGTILPGTIVPAPLHLCLVKPLLDVKIVLQLLQIKAEVFPTFIDVKLASSFGFLGFCFLKFLVFDDCLETSSNDTDSSAIVSASSSSQFSDGRSSIKSSSLSFLVTSSSFIPDFSEESSWSNSVANGILLSWHTGVGELDVCGGGRGVDCGRSGCAGVAVISDISNRSDCASGALVDSNTLS